MENCSNRKTLLDWCEDVPYDSKDCYEDNVTYETKRTLIQKLLITT